MIDFAQWDQQCSQSTRGKDTIRGYISALKNAPAHLSLTLPMDILDCPDAATFASIRALIEGSDRFEEVNAKGHNKLSSALKAFGEYMDYCDSISASQTAYAKYSPEWFANIARENKYTQFLEQAEKARRDFVEQFGLEWLKSLSGKDVLYKIFLHPDHHAGNLCYTLEYDDNIGSMFGSISGFAPKYGLFFHKENKKWASGPSNKMKFLTEDEAIEIASNMRDELVRGAEIILDFGRPSCLEDYRKLYRQLDDVDGINRIWVLKYYQMLFPDVLPVFYAKNIQVEVINFINEKPSSIPFIRMGQIELFVKKCGIPSEVFGFIYRDICHSGNNESGEEDCVQSDEMGIMGKSSNKKKAALLPSNTILYGPPGTGKTYSVAAVVQLIRDGVEPTAQMIAGLSAEELEVAKSAFSGELKDINGHIAFTTFHQSFAYEEFIEGIRPVMDNDDSDTGEIKYEIKPGVFKEFCERAAKPIAVDTSSLEINDQPTVWKVSLAGTGDNPVRTECLKNNHIRIGWDGYGPEITDETVFDDGGKDVLDRLYNRMAEGDIVLSCYSAKTIDAVGVVKNNVYWDDGYDNYKRVREVKWLVKDIDYDIVDKFSIPTMTLSTIYRLKLDKANVMEIMEECNAIPASATKQNDEPYFFIIDEINRGNISKIFGELITLIEGSKREGCDDEQSATLPYSGKPFTVPRNVHIIGTMNTADRSIALMDTALRRRFDFIEMIPQHELLADINIENINIGAMLEAINKRIEVLYDREHTIGHAYFMELIKNQTFESLSSIFRRKVFPLLQEYFFDDYEKIRLVLGDNQKDDETIQFVQRESNFDYESLFGNQDSELFDDELTRYAINEDAFSNPDSYIEIYN